MSLSYRPLSSQALYFVSVTGTTAVAHQALTFFDSHGWCTCVCVCVPCCLRERTHNLKRGTRMLRRGQGDTNPHFLEISKSTVQLRLQHQQRYGSSTTAPALQTLAFVTATVLLCSYVCIIHQEIIIHAAEHTCGTRYTVVLGVNREVCTLKVYPKGVHEHRATSFCDVISQQGPFSGEWLLCTAASKINPTRIRTDPHGSTRIHTAPTRPPRTIHHTRRTQGHPII